MYTKIDTSIIKKATSVQTLEFIDKFQSFLSTLEELGDFEICNCPFEVDKCSCLLQNEYGYYTNKIVMHWPDAQIEKQLSQSLLLLGKKLVEKAVGYTAKYKMAMTHAYKFLVHFIPNEDFIKNFQEKQSDITNMIDESLLMDQYAALKKSHILKQGSVYGICVGEEIVYIGETSRPLIERIKEHLDAIAKPPLKDQKYHELSLIDKNLISFKILYEVTDGITQQELFAIERALISAYKPRYNIQGVYKPYDTNTPIKPQPFLNDKLDSINEQLNLINQQMEQLQKLYI